MWRLASDESVVRSFEEVVDLSPTSDPFLLGQACAARAGTPPAKLRLPAIEPALVGRLEAAKLLLLEEEVGLAVFGDHDRRGEKCLTQQLPNGTGRSSETAAVDIHDITGGKDNEALARIAPTRLLPFLPGKAAVRPRSRPASSPSCGRRGHLAAVRAAVVGLSPEPAEGSPPAAAANDRRRSSPLLLGIDTPRKLQVLKVLSMQSDRAPSERSALLEHDSSQDSLRQEMQVLGDEDEEQVTILDLTRIGAIFRRFQLDAQIHQDDMVEALRRLGFLHPVKEWIEQAIFGLTAYTTLSANEFVVFCNAYEDLVRADCRDKLERYDTDASKRLERSEFAALLRDMGIEPMDHVLEEIIGEVDKDCNGDLDFAEFFKVMNLIQKREGFAKSEWDHFVEVFERFDRDKTGEMDSRELLEVLCFLGYHCTQEDAAAVAQEVDFDGSGCLDQHEFLVCMRKFREREMQSLKSAMRHCDLDMGGTLGTDELQTLMHTAGYFPEETVVKEVLEDIGAGLRIQAKQDGSFCLGLLWQFLVLFRTREGLCRADVEEVDSIFAKYTSGLEMSISHLPKIMRYLGHMLSYDEQQRLIKKVDVDQSGALSVGELRKFVRILREQRSRLIYNAFTKHMDKTKDVIPQSAVGEVLHGLGCVKYAIPNVPIPQDDAVSFVNGGFSLKAFMRLARRFFAELDQDVRQNCGYSSKELEKLKAQFKTFDADNSGEISNKELIGLVQAVFPDMAVDPRLRPHLEEILREADNDGNGALDFQDFLRLMRTVAELRYRSQLDKEQNAVKDAGFSAQEVHDFRDIFIGQAGVDQVLSQSEFKELIKDFCPMSNRNCGMLSKFWTEALHFYRSPAELDAEVAEEYDDMTVDFPEFLWLMKRILSTNFGNVLKRTECYVNASGTMAATDSAPAAPARVKHDLSICDMLSNGGGDAFERLANARKEQEQEEAAEEEEADEEEEEEADHLDFDPEMDEEEEMEEAEEDERTRR